MTRSLPGCIFWGLLAMACRPPSQEEPMSKRPPPAEASTPPPRASSPVIPPGSADYSAALADASLYKRGELSFQELQKRVIARALPPHPLGDAYLMMTPPPPPPGVHFDPLLMPGDWVGTWGEMAMTHFAGQLTREEYERLHAEAHPHCPR